MKKYKKIICLDLDGVICETKLNYYDKSKPKKDVIKYINYLYKKNFYIKIFTARHMTKFKGDTKKIYKFEYLNTYKQLKSWKISFHELIMGKPSYDYFIDDKCPYHKKNWPKILNNKISNE